MKIKKHTNKLVAGKAAFDQHGIHRFGDDYDPRATQFAAIVNLALECERDSNPEVQANAPGWWKNHILPHLEHMLRNAFNTKDGSYFRALANWIDQQGKRPVDPLREWICRKLFKKDHEGRYEQPYRDCTSDELHRMFTEEHTLNRVRLDVFTRTLGSMGAEWKKTRGQKKKF